MNLDEYYKLATNFAKYKTVDYPFFALSEEVGELMGKLAKYSRKHQVTVSDAVSAAAIGEEPHELKLRADMISEIGDVLWNLCECFKMAEEHPSASLSEPVGDYDSNDYPFLLLARYAGEVSGSICNHAIQSEKNIESMAHSVSDMTDSSDGVMRHQPNDFLLIALASTLWALIKCCDELGLDLEVEVAEANLDKIADRDSRNVIVSEGDNR